MRIRLWVVTVLAILGLTVPGSVNALSCIPLQDVIANMDVIVRGRIAAIPSNGVMELSVSRYLKGGGGAPRISAQVPSLGQGQRMDWESVPRVGDELIVGFVSRGDGLINEACHLFIQVKPGQALPKEVKDLLGDGMAPDGDTQTEPAPQIAERGESRLIWAPVGGLVLVSVGAWAVWRWRRRRA